MKECCVAYMNEQFGNDAELVKEIYGEYVSSIRVKIGEAEKAGTFPVHYIQVLDVQLPTLASGPLGWVEGLFVV